MKRGFIVQSLAGHDKGDFQVIFKSDKKFAFVCDGKNRTIEKPKKKNIIHLKFTNKKLEEKFLETNKSLKTALRNFCGKVKTV